MKWERNRYCLPSWEKKITKLLVRRKEIWGNSYSEQQGGYGFPQPWP
jgi:hypothetical protein